MGDYIGIMENKMETTMLYWRYIGFMENTMETTVLGFYRVYRVDIGVVLEL